MKPFATTTQMAERSQGLIPADTPFLDFALRAASNKIRNYCGWHIAPNLSTTVRVREATDGVLYLPSLHITAIAELTIDGTAVDLTEHPVDFDPDTGWSNISACRTAIVKITHGYTIPAEPPADDAPEDEELVPADLVDLTLMIASRALGAPLGYTREQSGQRSVSHSLTAAGVAGGTVLMPHERDDITTYKLGWLP